MLLGRGTAPYQKISLKQTRFAEVVRLRLSPGRRAALPHHTQGSTRVPSVRGKGGMYIRTFRKSFYRLSVFYTLFVIRFPFFRAVRIYRG